MKPRTAKLILGLMLAACGLPAYAEPSGCPRPADMPAANMPAPKAMREMKMEGTMPSAMARPGTPMMDVTMGAAAKEHCMQPMLGHDEKMMDKAMGEATPAGK